MGRDEKYFIKDEALKTSDDDFFGHVDIANNIYRMIVYTEAPFNIAIIGKWGMGKSSLINIVKKMLEKDPDKYLVQEINAWKYQKEEFGKTFLKQLFQLIEKKEITSQHQFQECLGEYIKPSASKVTDKSLKDIFHEFPKNIIRFVRSHWKGIGFFLITIIAVIVYKSIAMQMWLWENFGEILRQSFLSYCKNVVAILIVPLFVWYGKLYMDKKMGEENVQLGVNFPVESRDDYEVYLNGVLKNEQNKDKKIVTIIDDLDRLDMGKIVEALDALKVFMNLNNCIFIVPFDDAILKRALEEKRVNKLNSIESTIDSELILDKLFQYKVYIPELVKVNIGKYSVELFRNNCTDFVHEYMHDDMEEACRIVQNVIIHKHVTTPRQVKKLINNFVNNMIIAVERERKGVIQKEFATGTKSIQYIAKISVLQADFNEFYDILYSDMDAMEKMLSIYRKGGDVEIPEELQLFFEKPKEGEKYVLKSKYQSLVDYLIHTENYNSVSAKASYLYMAQDKISALTGDRKQQEFIAALLSWNDVAVRETLENTSVMAEKLMDYIRMEEDENEVMTACVMTINMMGYIDETYRDELIRLMASRMEICATHASESGIEHMNIDQYFVIRQQSEDIPVFDRILVVCLKKIEYEEMTQGLIHDLLKHRSEFTIDVKEQVKENINNYVSECEYGLGEADEITQGLSTEEMREYFPEELFHHVAQILLATKNFQESVAVSFARYFKAYVNKDNVIDKAEQILLDLVTDTNAHRVLYEALRESKLLKELPDELGKELVNKLISNDPAECSDATYALLSNLPCNFGEEEDASNFDIFVDHLQSDKAVADIIVHFMENGNNVLIFEHTISHITKEVVEDNNRLELFERIEKYYNEEQRSVFLSSLNKKLVYLADKKYSQEIELIRELHRKQIWVAKVVSLIENTVYTHVTGTGGRYLSYFSFAVELVIELKEEFSQDKLDKLASAFLERYTSFPKQSLDVINSIGSLLSDEEILKIVNQLVKEPDENFVDEIAQFLFAHYLMFNEKNGNLNELVQFIDKYWDNLSDKTYAVSTLTKRYSKINYTNLKEISLNILKGQEQINQLGEGMSKFYNNLDHANFVNLMVALSRKFSPVEMKKLLFGNQANRSIDDILSYVGDNAESFTNMDLQCMIEIYDDCRCKKIGAWKQICRQALQANVDVEANQRILSNIVEKVKSVQIDKEKVIDLLLCIYNNTASDDLRADVVKDVCDLKITRKFKGLLKEEETKAEFDKIQKMNKHQ